MENSRFSQSIKNMIIAFISQGLTLSLSFVARSIFILFLSVEYLGINGLFSNVLTLLSFAELGIGNVMVYSLYKPIKNRDYDKINALLELYKTSYRIIASVIFSIGILIMPFIEFLIKEKPNININIHLIYFLFLVDTIVSYFFTYKKSLLIANQKSYVINLTSNIIHVIQMIVQCIVLYITRNFVIYLAIQIICTLLNNIILSYYVNKKYTFLKQSVENKISLEERSKIFLDVKALAISKISGVVANGTDNIIMSKLLGIITVGIASNYLMIINSVNSIAYNMLTSTTASIGNFNVRSNDEDKLRVFNQLFTATYLIYSFVCICIMVLINPFIIQWLGREYLFHNYTIFALVLNIYIGGINYPVYVFRTTMGYFKEVKYVYVASALFNLVLSILLGKTIGVTGIFIATALSKLFTTEIADGYYSYKVIMKQPFKRYVLKYFVYIFLLIVNYIITNFAISMIPYKEWIGLIIKGITCAFLTIVINTIFLYRSKAFIQLLRRFIK